MAVSAAGRRLTEMHKRELLKLRTRTARELVELWKLIDPEALDASFAAYVGAALNLVAQNRQTSARLGSEYLRAFRTAEGVEGELRALERSTFDVTRVSETLRINGPVRAKALIARGHHPSSALRTVLVVQTGVLTRFVQDAARETVDRGVADDLAALGWMRITDGDACAFCALLASRGPSYKSRETALFADTGQRYHDHCGCTVEPVYSRTTELPASTVRYRELWKSVSAEFSGDDVRRAFRARLEGRPYPPVPGERPSPGDTT